MLPSSPAEPEANFPTLHSSTEEEPVDPTVSSIEVRSDESPETQPILSETTTVHPNVNVSIPEPTLIPKATPEEVDTKADAADDKRPSLLPLLTTDN